MKIDNDPKLDFDDVLLVPQRSKLASRKDVNISREFGFYHSPKRWHGIPIIAANMDTTGTYNMATALTKYNAVTCLHKHHNIDRMREYFVHTQNFHNAWVSVGMGKTKADWREDLEKLEKIRDAICEHPNICIDVANGYTERFVEWCAHVRQYFPESIIMAGNVCTPEMVSELILHGKADIVKVGIGPGSACTTRLKTGVGYPQLSAIIECVHAAHGLSSDTGNGLICSDGGCMQAGDVAKAFAAGADFVMLGGMLAGTDECEGEWKSEGGKNYFVFYGMSSKKAQEKNGNGLEHYRSSEGRVKRIECKGPVGNVIQDILGGIRSACTYTGATCLKNLNKTAKFIRVNRIHHDRSVEE